MANEQSEKKVIAALAPFCVDRFLKSADATQSADLLKLTTNYDRGNFLEQVRRGALWINEGLMLAEKFVGELATAANPSCFYERKPFPGFAETSIVIFHALERAGEWSSSPFRPKAEVDPEKCPGRT